MTSSTSLPVIYDDGVYAPILRVFLDLMTPDERRPIFEILAIDERSENEETAS